MGKREDVSRIEAPSFGNLALWVIQSYSQATKERGNEKTKEEGRKGEERTEVEERREGREGRGEAKAADGSLIARAGR